MDVEDTYKLPYGLWYDHIIKQKTDEINSQKVSNNLVMDELVQKLGYIDYRDALACNKYILESKRHSDYHQQARARILQVAFQRYNAQRKLEIEKMASAHLSPSNDNNKNDKKKVDNMRDEYKFREVIDNDPNLSELYRETYSDIKTLKEHDENEANRVYEKFDFLKDPNNYKHNNVYMEQYDVIDEQNEEEKVISTDLTDTDLDLMYKRYKMLQIEVEEHQDDQAEEKRLLIEQFKYNTKIEDQKLDEKPSSYFDLKNKLYMMEEKQIKRGEFLQQLDTIMTMIRL